MRVRKKINGLRQFGQGQKNFWVNVPDGVGQCIATRLLLWRGQWFLNLVDGTDYLGKILGKGTAATSDVEVRSRVLGTDGVLEITSYSSSLDRTSRRWPVSMTVQTRFGQIQVSGYLPGPAPTAGIGYFEVGYGPIGQGGLG